MHFHLLVYALSVIFLYILNYNSFTFENNRGRVNCKFLNPAQQLFFFKYSLFLNMDSYDFSNTFEHWLNERFTINRNLLLLK